MRKPDAEARPHHISRGEFAIGRRDGGSITTTLGSCVATCIHDPVARVGGMNHFLLPDGKGSNAPAASFGINAMELLINALIKQGAIRSRLQAKVFGGARIVAGLSDVGEQNATFIRDFLRREAILCVGQSLGGTQARRVMFWPEGGHAKQKLLGESAIVERAPVPVPANDVELF